MGPWAEIAKLRAEVEQYRDALADRDRELAAAEAAHDDAHAKLTQARTVLHEFVNVGDFYERAPLAAMIERLAPSLGFELRSDWRTFVTLNAIGVGCHCNRHGGQHATCDTSCHEGDGCVGGISGV